MHRLADAKIRPAKERIRASVEQTRAWQEQVPGSELVVLPGDSYHIAVTDPDACAAATLEFLRRRVRLP